MAMISPNLSGSRAEPTRAPELRQDQAFGSRHRDRSQMIRLFRYKSSRQ
jgi:hypothetical protein